MVRVSKAQLLSFLEPFDNGLSKPMALVAVGGTAMTLLGIKASTKDVDFNIPDSGDCDIFRKLYKKINPGVTIDFWPSNMIFSEVLPDDYLDRATDYETDFKNIRIRVLSPIDIACSKISRLSGTDEEDIRDCIGYAKIKKREFEARAGQFSCAGADRIFKENLRYVLGHLF